MDGDPEAGTFEVHRELFADTFMHDCREVADEAAARLARQSVQLTQQPVEAAVWSNVPTSSLVCAQDRGTPAERQRQFARRADHVSEVDTGRHAFLSQPAFVRDLVLSLA